MAFFDLDKDTHKLTSTSQAWMFPIITILLTIAVFAVWIFWRRRRSKVIEGEMRTRPRLQDDDIEAGVVHEGFIVGGPYPTINGQEEAVPLREMNNEGAKRKFWTRQK